MNNSSITLRAGQNPEQNNLGDGYLKFFINPQTSAILSMNQTQEAMVVSVESVTSMPNMPFGILGLMNWRSRILWVVDLPKLLNLQSPQNRPRQYSVIVVRTESMILGLVVHEIIGTLRFNSEEIRSPIGQVASSLVPYLRGCIVQQKEILLVLDAQPIVHSSNLRSE
ncbi:putative CheW protein [Calothrix parasitica NIES-267]|uniref:Putative CheW protein n=1 Tax=Calothrix parasitica NIES-267 TaxID=1973488 RepID=A0A1Z4LZH3_9CYAN|nr:putative CheW protein [Calothrix parasitica NIES-267]